MMLGSTAEPTPKGVSPNDDTRFDAGRLCLDARGTAKDGIDPNSHFPRM